MPYDAFGKEWKFHEDVVDQGGLAYDRRLGKRVDVPKQDLAFITDTTLAEVLVPEALNSGNVVDIYQQREEDFEATTQLEISYMSNGQRVSEVVFCDNPNPPSVPRICVTVDAVKAMQRAIEVLTRKVDNLVNMLRSCRTNYYKELFHLRHGREPSETGNIRVPPKVNALGVHDLHHGREVHEAYWFNPKAYQDTATVELLEERLNDKVVEMQEEIEEKNKRIAELLKEMKHGNEDDDDMEGGISGLSQSELNRVRRSLTGLPIDQMIFVLKKTVEGYKGRKATLLNSIEKILAEARAGANAEPHETVDLQEFLDLQDSFEKAQTEVQDLTEKLQHAESLNNELTDKMQHLEASGGFSGSPSLRMQKMNASFSPMANRAAAGGGGGDAGHWKAMISALQSEKEVLQKQNAELTKKVAAWESEATKTKKKLDEREAELTKELSQTKAHLNKLFMMPKKKDQQLMEDLDFEDHDDDSPRAKVGKSRTRPLATPKNSNQATKEAIAKGGRRGSGATIPQLMGRKDDGDDDGEPLPFGHAKSLKAEMDEMRKQHQDSLESLKRAADEALSIEEPYHSSGEHPYHSSGAYSHEEDESTLETVAHHARSSSKRSAYHSHANMKEANEAAKESAKVESDEKDDDAADAAEEERHGSSSQKASSALRPQPPPLSELSAPAGRGAAPPLPQPQGWNLLFSPVDGSAEPKQEDGASAEYPQRQRKPRGTALPSSFHGLQDFEDDAEDDEDPDDQLVDGRASPNLAVPEHRRRGTAAPGALKQPKHGRSAMRQPKGAVPTGYADGESDLSESENDMEKPVMEERGVQTDYVEIGSTFGSKAATKEDIGSRVPSNKDIMAESLSAMLPSSATRKGSKQRAASPAGGASPRTTEHSRVFSNGENSDDSDPIPRSRQRSRQTTKVTSGQEEDLAGFTVLGQRVGSYRDLHDNSERCRSRSPIPSHEWNEGSRGQRSCSPPRSRSKNESVEQTDHQQQLAIMIKAAAQDEPLGHRRQEQLQGSLYAAIRDRSADSQRLQQNQDVQLEMSGQMLGDTLRDSGWAKLPSGRHGLGGVRSPSKAEPEPEDDQSFVSRGDTGTVDSLRESPISRADTTTLTVVPLTRAITDAVPGAVTGFVAPKERKPICKAAGTQTSIGFEDLLPGWCVSQLHPSAGVSVEELAFLARVRHDLLVWCIRYIDGQDASLLKHAAAQNLLARKKDEYEAISGAIAVTAEQASDLLNPKRLAAVPKATAQSVAVRRIKDRLRGRDGGVDFFRASITLSGAEAEKASRSLGGRKFFAKQATATAAKEDAEVAQTLPAITQSNQLTWKKLGGMVTVTKGSSRGPTPFSDASTDVHTTSRCQSALDENSVLSADTPSLFDENSLSIHGSQVNSITLSRQGLPSSEHNSDLSRKGWKERENETEQLLNKLKERQPRKPLKAERFNSNTPPRPESRMSTDSLDSSDEEGMAVVPGPFKKHENERRRSDERRVSELTDLSALAAVAKDTLVGQSSFARRRSVDEPWRPKVAHGGESNRNATTILTKGTPRLGTPEPPQVKGEEVVLPLGVSQVTRVNRSRG